MKKTTGSPANGQVACPGNRHVDPRAGTISRAVAPNLLRRLKLQVPFRALLIASLFLMGGLCMAQSTALPVVQSISPASGRGLVRTFSMSVSDPLGISDLKFVRFLFNTLNPVSGAEACSGVYYPASDEMFLYEDDGSINPAKVTLGFNGFVSNSRCKLNSGASSVRISGNTLTLNVALTFPVFSQFGLYLSAGGSAGTTPFVHLGSWLAESLVSLPPNGIFNGEVGSTSSPRMFNLSNEGKDALTIASITLSGLNSSDFAQTNTCGSVVPSGGLCAISITFTPSAFGVRTAQLVVKDNADGIAGSTQTTSLTSNQVGAPIPELVSPSSGRGLARTFSMSVSDPLGLSDLKVVRFTFGNTAKGPGACSGLYYPALDEMFLYDDSGTTTLPAKVTLGFNGFISNSQCQVNSGASSVSTSGNTLTLNVALTFNRNLPGNTRFGFYLSAQGKVENTDFVQLGSWQVQSLVSLPNYAVFTAETGTTSSPELFDVTNDGRDALAIASIAFSGPNASDFAQTNDCGSALPSGGTCTISVTFTPAAYGIRTTNLIVTDNADGISGSTQSAYFVGNQYDVPISVSPSAGTGLRQIFSMVFEYPGASSLASFPLVRFLFNSSLSFTNACMVLYYPSSNEMVLFDDGGQNALPTSVRPGVYGTVSNSQCTLNNVGSSVSISGSTLTLNVALTFSKSFIGQKQIFLSGLGSVNSLQPFIPEGTWTP
jgi:hypothetical protein